MESRIVQTSNEHNATTPSNHIFNNSYAKLLQWLPAETSGRKSPLPESLETSKPEDLALKAAHEVGARTYFITGLQDQDNPVIWTLGCQGNGGTTQQAVAELMNKIITEQPHKKPDIVLFLGDNFYDYGVNSPTAEAFISHFHNIYRFKQPCVLILGNHDGNFQIKARFKNYTLLLEQGRDLEFNQVAHTYIPDGKKYQTTEQLRDLYMQETISLDALQQFNMPYSFYSLIMGSIQLFCLDSNLLVYDFLKYRNHVIDDQQPNQIQWLVTEYEKAKKAGRTIYFAQHHAPITSGKRAKQHGHDSNHYLAAEQIIAVNTILESNTTSYNELIALIFKKLQLLPDKCLAAHDHFLCIDDRDYLVLTNGGGGGHLQTRKSCMRHPDVKLLLSQNGFNILSKDIIETYTTAGWHLIYDAKKHEFIREPSKDEAIESLRTLTYTIRNEFFDALKKSELSIDEQNQKSPESSSYSSAYYFFSTTSKKVSDYLTKVSDYLFPGSLESEVKCADELLAYFNQSTLPDYVTVMKFLSEHLEQLRPPPDKKEPISFFDLFQDKIQQLGINLEHLEMSSLVHVQK